MTAPTLSDLRDAAKAIQQAERVLEDARANRDRIMRELRQQGTFTAPELAEAAEVSLATVKSVIRGIR